jgi:tRNA 5-methylaminomethyl-2-thiouridine biosynthesis bifunctional protein
VSPGGFDPGAAWDGEALVSARFGDVYASRSGALAQSRAVFLDGCGLPERWAARRRFTVAELGFGTGLNMLAVLEAWVRTRAPGAVLNLFSVEGFPLARADAARALSAQMQQGALAAHGELAALVERLLAQWPDGARGVHRIDFPDLGAVLDLAIGDVAEMVAGWDGAADAWFLDGFSPAKNPEMWSAELLALVGARTAPDGRAATWSVAGAVRRGLAGAGFAVERLPGFGWKRERISAVMPGAAAEAVSPRVAVIGAGISGAALALAFRDLSVEARLFADGAMASGNPAALVSPRLAAGSEAGAGLHALAFRRAVERVTRTAPEAVIARGAERLLKPGEIARAEATVASGLFAPGSLALDGERLLMRDALVVAPLRVRAAWLGDVEPLAVRGLVRDGAGWWIQGDGRRQGPFDAVCVAAGFGSAGLAGVPLKPVRGQVAVSQVRLDGPPTSWGGYVIPTDDGLLFGATHGRGDAGDDVRDAETLRNVEGLAKVMPELAAQVAAGRLSAVAGVRAAAGDHQPLAGALGDGLFVLGGLGGRGFTLAPLLAEHVASQVMGAPSPLTAAMARLVDPARLGPATGRGPARLGAAPRAGGGDVRRDSPSAGEP